MKQLHAYFYGRVQGVFFRQTAKEIADSLGLTGFVKNLPDGRVELLAEGEKEKLQKLLNELNNNFDISSAQVKWTNNIRKLSSFKIES